MQSPSVVHEQEHRQVDESGEEARAAAVRSLAIPRARGQSSSEMPRAAQMAIEVGGASKGKKSGESERVKEVSIATWATLPPQAAPHACQPGRAGPAQARHDHR
jgi:hypothetical protein